MTEPADDAARRLAAARTRLILDHPFLGALALRLPLKAAGRWCATTATDARALYYNPRWIASLKPAELQFAVAHEALHCALGHFARRGHRVQRRWDLACDFAINPLLLDEGLAPPPGAPVLPPYRGMSAEEIYPCLDDRLDDDTLDEHAWDGDDGGRGGRGDGAPHDDAGGGDGRAQERPAGAGDACGDARPPPLGATEREHLRRQWQRHLAAAAQRAREAGRLAGALARLADEGLAPRVSWRAALAQYLAQTARDDYSWLRPSRREGDAMLPSLRSAAGDLVVAVDTSGSIGDADIAQFVAELNALKGTLPVRTTLLACDSALADDAPWVAEAWEPLRVPAQWAGGGGTDFRPVFDWIERQGRRPDALVYFTDAEGSFPARAPDYPVLWLVKGRAPVPWGRRVALA
ncbi:VWA-like domain-containing protein [Azohydromonas sp.]|uniref:vWA domain-containing protein n=1 Tax=Azohydromonas sp. TaxID=1872666 RepID=UPI002C1412C2|nr:VWA-like domain-containing protein [Azohydromonas sp.]HMM87097.1 VWA-like domain-containing protein [Azohydromonas sp.]